MEAKGKSTAIDALEWMDWADVTHADIYSYLILMLSMTHEQLKAYKSLGGFNHFVNGWVSGVTFVIVPHSRPKGVFVHCHSEAFSSPFRITIKSVVWYQAEW